MTPREQHYIEELEDLCAEAMGEQPKEWRERFKKILLTKMEQPKVETNEEKRERFHQETGKDWQDDISDYIAWLEEAEKLKETQKR